MFTELFSTGIVVKHRVDFAHRLKDHPGLCSNLHGHTWKVKVKIQGKVDEVTGMIVDFGELKGLVRRYLDGNYDHSTVLQKGDIYIRMIQSDGKRLLVLDQPPTTEVLAARMAKGIQEILDEKYEQKLEIKSLELRETPSNIVVIENDAA